MNFGLEKVALSPEFLQHAANVAEKKKNKLHRQLASADRSLDSNNIKKMIEKRREQHRVFTLGSVKKQNTQRNSEFLNKLKQQLSELNAKNKKTSKMLEDSVQKMKSMHSQYDSSFDGIVNQHSFSDLFGEAKTEAKQVKPKSFLTHFKNPWVLGGLAAAGLGAYGLSKYKSHRPDKGDRNE